jgi:SAM-dependent methyltransferase
MLFEIRGLMQNLVFGIAPVRRFVHRRLGRTGMNGDRERAHECFERYGKQVDVRGKHVLELGPGHTPEVLAIAHDAGAARCVGLDIERLVDAAHLRQLGVELETYEGKGMPFDAQSFDVIWSSDVLEHVRYPERTIAECFRVLRPGGIMLAAIDLRDHYFLHREEKWLNCLKYPEPLWLAMCSNRSSFVNRLRSSEWRLLFSEVGFDIRAFEEQTSTVLEELHRRGETPRYGRPLLTADAPIYRIDIVLQRPSSA